MKETIDKIKEICEKYKKELVVLGVVCLAALFLKEPKSAKETALISETPQTEELLTTEAESSASTETETETETESETEVPSVTKEELERILRRLRARYGSSFQVPMNIPQERTSLTLRTLEDTRSLHDYQTLDPETQRGEVAEWAGDKATRQLSDLQAALEEQLAAYDGKWSVYVKNLSADESFVINDSPMKSASVMKLFIMGTVYKAFESGDLERTDEIMALVKDMIIYSDNEDSNQLLYHLGDSDYAAGIAKVDEFIQEYGFSEMTVEYNGFNNSATNTSSEHFNQVSAKDCGKLLEDIYRRNWVGREVSNEMEELLLSQNTRYKIPAGLPEGVLCGNKTGEMSSVENDAAIIYAGDCDYILVVLSNDWSSKDKAISRIRSISSTVYEYLNEE